jgi:hypothetical protein
VDCRSCRDCWIIWTGGSREVMVMM